MQQSRYWLGYKKETKQEWLTTEKAAQRAYGFSTLGDFYNSVRQDPENLVWLWS